MKEQTGEEEVVTKPAFSDEEVDLISKGIRPDSMDYNIFKYYRKLANNYVKVYLKGKYKHVSSWIEPVEGTKEFIRKTSTYIKPIENA